MPPKRRSTVGAADAPEPKRRQTRSSAKPAIASEALLKSNQVSSTQVPKAKSSKSKIEESKLPKPKAKTQNSKSPKSKPSKPSKTGRAKASEDKEPTTKSANSTNTNSNITNLTIDSALIKNPIQAQLWAYSTPSSPSQSLIFTHGAGGTLSAPAVINFCNGYSTSSPVLAFQGSMNLGARVKGFHACIEHLKDQGDAKSMVLGGRSMGARAAVIAATETISSDSTPGKVDLVLVSYPLQGPKDVRDQILLDLPAHVNVLFVAGDRDAMCPLDLLRNVIKKMKAQSWLVVVEGMDHGMHGKSERVLGERSGRVAADWVAGERGQKEMQLNKDG